MSRLLDDLRGSTPILELASRTGRSRFAIARWLKGQAEPRLPDFLRVLEAASQRLLDFLAQLVDPARLRAHDVTLDAVMRAASDAVVVSGGGFVDSPNQRLAVRHLAHRVAAQSTPGPVGLLVVAGLLVGTLAVVFRATADRPVDLVLFSGQAELPAVVAEGSAGVLMLLVVAKGLAYALSLGAGFRGGPVFPAIALGVAAAMVAANVLPGLHTTPAVATGIAAGTTAVLRVPFTAVLLVSLLMGPSAFDVAPIAVLAAALAWLVATWLPNPEDRVQDDLAEAAPAASA